MIPVKRPEAVRVHSTLYGLLVTHGLRTLRHMLFSASLFWAPTRRVLCGLTARSREVKIPCSLAVSLRA